MTRSNPHQQIIDPVDKSERSNKARGLWTADGSGIGRTGVGDARSCRKVLDDAMANAQSSGSEADNRLYDRPGERPAEVVAEAANEWKADLVVVGTAFIFIDV